MRKKDIWFVRGMEPPCWGEGESALLEMDAVGPTPTPMPTVVGGRWTGGPASTVAYCVAGGGGGGEGEGEKRGVWDAPECVPHEHKTK